MYFAKASALLLRNCYRAFKADECWGWVYISRDQFVAVVSEGGGGVIFDDGQRN